MSKPVPLSPARAGSTALTLPTGSDAPSVGILSRTLLSTPDVRVVTMHFADGEELTTHTSNRRALVQVVVGACDFCVDDQWARLAAGELMHLPPNQPHAVRASHGAFTLLLTLSAEPTSSQP